MVSPLRIERFQPRQSVVKIRLMLRNPQGAPWGVTLSVGMERFIGPYSRVPGLSSDSSLLEYQPVG